MSARLLVLRVYDNNGRILPQEEQFWHLGQGQKRDVRPVSRSSPRQHHAVASPYRPDSGEEVIIVLK